MGAVIEKKVFCDKCDNEVEYYLLPRYNVEDIFKELTRRMCSEKSHLCEKCMHELKTCVYEAVKEWINSDNPAGE